MDKTKGLTVYFIPFPFLEDQIHHAITKLYWLCLDPCRPYLPFHLNLPTHCAKAAISSCAISKSTV